MTLRNKLIQLRDQAGMTQQDLAEALHISRQTITRWESGKCLPSQECLLTIATLYGVSMNWLCDETKDFPEATRAVSQPTEKVQELETAVVRPRKCRACKRKVVIIVIESVVILILAMMLVHMKYYRDRVHIDDMPYETISPEEQVETFDFEW